MMSLQLMDTRSNVIGKPNGKTKQRNQIRNDEPGIIAWSCCWGEILWRFEKVN